MRANTLVRTAVVGIAALAASVTSLRAFCNSAIETYAIFQCGQRGYFAPVPSPFTPSQVTGVFWQLGFGNASVSTGLGTDGTGFASKAFNGNDSGYFPLDILNAAVRFPTVGFPPGSVCLGSNNWANSGVDGCCDNTRSAASFDYVNYYAGFGNPYPYPNDDDILNPYFGVYFYRQNYPGYFSRASIQDYPTAVLLKLPDDAYFAVAAVTNAGVLEFPADRGNNFDPNDTSTWTGPCATAQGTNDAACDNSQGTWFLSHVTTGTPNAIPSEAGKNNVIPWQVPPVPVIDPNTVVADPNDPSRVIVDLSWTAIAFHHDGRSVPSNHPTMDAVSPDPNKPRDPNAASGVGVPDILGKFGSARYELQVADVHDPLFSNVTMTITCPGDPSCPTATSATLSLLDSECVRIRTHLGVPSRVSVPSLVDCRLGKCGDLGLNVIGERTCVSTCDPIPGGEQCNGLDEDCDVEVDEDFSIGQACNGIGECGQGNLECLNPTTAICSTEPGGSDGDPNDIGDPNYAGPTPELCEGLDNDCDTLVDEDFVLGGTCTGAGECAVDPNGNPFPGTIECHSTDPNTTQCSTDPGGTLDQSDPETCDTLDNDCDAQTDEDFSLGMACDGEGLCGAGLIECDPNDVGAICSTEPGGSGDQSIAESCDALDNDCDASTDEDFNVGGMCDGEGECGQGTIECLDPNTSICSTEPGGSAHVPTPEACDALDNDCDASTDEDFNIGQVCNGEGECGAGVRECNPTDPNDMDFCSTDAGGSADESVPETCGNLLDEDCDGQTDEGGAEVCDGGDNDCDGQTDENFTAISQGGACDPNTQVCLGLTCDGVGACGTGVGECSTADPNVSICSTDRGGSQDQSATELCEGTDNDCDGQTDEGFSVGVSCEGTGACEFDPPGDPNSPSFGVFECDPADSSRIVCSTDPGGSQDRSTTEVCGNTNLDERDEDCDGINDINEGFNLGQLCNPPGICDVGAFECDPNGMPATTFVCNTGPGGSLDQSETEFCDGEDDDCNGFVDDGSANQPQDCEVYSPATQATITTVDCSNPRAVQHQMRWHTRSFDVFRPQISWDPSFSSNKRLIQSYVRLETDFWEPNGKQWKKACAQARLVDPNNPILYFRVLRKDLDLAKSDPLREDITPVVVANAVYASADLEIAKTDSQIDYTPGNPVTYTIVVTNAGPADVVGATVTDAFPAALSNVSWTCTPSGGAACAASGNGNISESVDVPVGGSVAFTVTADVLASATGNLANTATVAVPGGVTDPEPSNDSATDTDTQASLADLSITKTDGVSTYTPGGSLTYTIVVANAGPSDVTGATVTDAFAAALTGVSWTCTPSGGASCAASGSGDINESVDIPAGAFVTFTVDANIDAMATGDLVNTATVAPPVTVAEANPADNSATDTDTP